MSARLAGEPLYSAPSQPVLPSRDVCSPKVLERTIVAGTFGRLGLGHRKVAEQGKSERGRRVRAVEWLNRRVLLIVGLLLILALLAPLPSSFDRDQLALGGLLLGTLRLALNR